MAPRLLPLLLPPLLALMIAPGIGGAGSAAEVPHMAWADRLLREITPNQNSYGARPTLLQWQGVDGQPITRNRTVCSSFVTRLLQRAYGLGSQEIRRWLGSPSPTAADYHRAIRLGHRFTPVATLSALRRGDLMAIDYRRPASAAARGGASTGHLMLVDAGPIPRWDRRLGPGERFFALGVIDSSRSGHGPQDSRGASAGPRGPGGVGRGQIGLLVDRRGRILAYSWSTLPRSPWFHQRHRSLVVGRLSGGRWGPAESAIRW